MRVSSLEERKLAFRRSALHERKTGDPLPLQASRMSVRRERKPRPQQPRRKGALNSVNRVPVAVKLRVKRLTPVSDVSRSTVSRALKVKEGNNAMDATVHQIQNGVRVQLTSGMSSDCTQNTGVSGKTEAGARHEHF